MAVPVVAHGGLQMLFIRQLGRGGVAPQGSLASSVGPKPPSSPSRALTGGSRVGPRALGHRTSSGRARSTAEGRTLSAAAPLLQLPASRPRRAVHACVCVCVCVCVRAPPPAGPHPGDSGPQHAPSPAAGQTQPPAQVPGIQPESQEDTPSQVPPAPPSQTHRQGWLWWSRGSPSPRTAHHGQARVPPAESGAEPHGAPRPPGGPAEQGGDRGSGRDGAPTSADTRALGSPGLGCRPLLPQAPAWAQRLRGACHHDPLRKEKMGPAGTPQGRQAAPQDPQQVPTWQPEPGPKLSLSHLAPEPITGSDVSLTQTLPLDPNHTPTLP